jgi:hypothetical protein
MPSHLSRLRPGGALLAAVLLAACGPLGEQPPAPPTAVPVHVPAAAAWPADATGTYILEEGDPQLRILVFRAGPLAALGHNHVISHRRLRGEILLEPDQTRFHIAVPVAGFEVDRPELRAEAGAGFERVPDPADAEATRENLLGERVLDVRRHQLIGLAGDLPARGPGRHRVPVRISLQGREIIREVPVQVSLAGDRLTAEGEFRLSHGELGLVLFTALGGLLAVAEEMTVRFHLTARLTTGETE